MYKTPTSFTTLVGSKRVWNFLKLWFKDINILILNAMITIENKNKCVTTLATFCEKHLAVFEIVFCCYVVSLINKINLSCKK